MLPKVCVTTSWDDGHPNDFRIAELLRKYDLPGTFYIPRTSEFGTMGESEIRELGSGFEIGAHTINHVVLPRADSFTARTEILDSKSWLEDLLGVECTVFCFPQGKFRPEHVAFVEQAGFLGARTVELLATGMPNQTTRPLILPTSVQALDHHWSAYVRNAAKRRALRGLGAYLRLGAPVEWDHLALMLLNRVAATGGTFHLWGHSWELEEEAQWNRLETVLDFISSLQCGYERVTNGQLCLELLSQAER